MKTTIDCLKSTFGSVTRFRTPKASLAAALLLLGGAGLCEASSNVTVTAQNLWNNNVIYTLERPTGMDTEQYSAGFSGPSFDCTKAKTQGEKLICADAGLAASDKKLAAAYRALGAA